MVQLDKRQAERDNGGETHQLESTNSFSGSEPVANLPGAPSDRPPETLKGCATKTASAPGKAGYGNGALPRDAGGKAFRDLLYFGERRHGGVAWGGHGQGAVGGDCSGARPVASGGCFNPRRNSSFSHHCNPRWCPWTA